MESENDQHNFVDLSQLDGLLSTVANEVGNLHGLLDGFASGSTDSLKGAERRHAIYSSLDNLDQALEQIREHRTAPLQRSKQIVTAALREKLNSTKDHAGVVRRLLDRTWRTLIDRGIRRLPPLSDAVTMQLAVLSQLEEMIVMTAMPEPADDSDSASQSAE